MNVEHAADDQQPRTRHYRVGLIFAAGTVLLSAAIGGVLWYLLMDSEGTDAADTAQRRFQGVVAVSDQSGLALLGGWDDCRGVGAFDDFMPSATVTVKNQDGKVLGETPLENLDPSKASEVETSPIGADFPGDLVGSLSAAEGSLCMMYFDAQVDEADSYTVSLSIAGSEKTKTFTAAELEQKDGWTFSVLSFP